MFAIIEKFSAQNVLLSLLLQMDGIDLSLEVLYLYL